MVVKESRLEGELEEEDVTFEGFPEASEGMRAGAEGEEEEEERTVVRGIFGGGACVISN